MNLDQFIHILGIVVLVSAFSLPVFYILDKYLSDRM